MTRVYVVESTDMDGQPDEHNNEIIGLALTLDGIEKLISERFPSYSVQSESRLDNGNFEKTLNSGGRRGIYIWAGAYEVRE